MILGVASGEVDDSIHTSKDRPFSHIVIRPSRVVATSTSISLESYSDDTQTFRTAKEHDLGKPTVGSLDTLPPRNQIHKSILLRSTIEDFSTDFNGILDLWIMLRYHLLSKMEHERSSADQAFARENKRNFKLHNPSTVEQENVQVPTMTSNYFLGLSPIRGVFGVAPFSGIGQRQFTPRWPRL
jgi:hypothetical protein